MSSLQPTLGFLVNDVARLFRRRFDQQAKHLGLTRSQYQTMAYLAHNEGIHQGALAEILEVEPITLVRILDRLEERGLVERRRHPTDRRLRLLFLTEAAKEPLTKMLELGAHTRAEALVGMSDADSSRLMEQLAQIKANLQEACSSSIEDKVLDHV